MKWCVKVRGNVPVLKIGVQQFDINPPDACCWNKAEAQWMAKMLRKAIRHLLKDKKK